METLRPILSRLIAPYIVGFVVWLTSFGVDLPLGTDDKLTELVVILIFASAQAAIGVIHKVIDKQVNPADAATVELAADGKARQLRSKVS